MKKCWIVWKEEYSLDPQRLIESMPKIKHPSLKEAKDEAERLSLKFPTTTFSVFELVGSCQKTNVHWTLTKD